MKVDIWELLAKFRQIRKKGEIESSKNGYASVGLTLERELGKKQEHSYLPDYKGIELKAKKSLKYGDVALFSLTPDSYENVIQDMCHKYGYPDAQIKNCKVLNTDFYCGRSKVFKNREFVFRLVIYRDDEQLALNVYDYFTDELVDTSIRWSFAGLKERLTTKLRYLAYLMR